MRHLPCIAYLREYVLEAAETCWRTTGRFKASAAYIVLLYYKYVCADHCWVVYGVLPGPGPLQIERFWMLWGRPLLVLWPRRHCVWKRQWKQAPKPADDPWRAGFKGLMGSTKMTASAEIPERRTQDSTASCSTNTREAAAMCINLLSSSTTLC